MLLMITATVAVSLVVFPKGVLPTTLRDAAYCSIYLGMLPALWGKVRFFGHAWSLSIEEAFYLLWPAALLALRQHRARVLFALLVVLACEAQRLRLWFIEQAPSQRVWVAIDTRAGAIALGCIVGLAMHSGTLVRARRALVWAAPVAAAALLVFARVADRRMTWYATWGYPAVALLATLVVARLLVAPSALLALPPLVWLGKLSYTIYLWHVPLITIGDELHWPIPLSIAVAVAAAWVSYRFVETPLRAH
jgi:peptidoglycan/LPS O-acetylase OafA/YrhL